jgi:phosphosulfolactate phosphohydrolase-like enzyme
METTTNPFAALIKSKRFWTMILTAAISFLVSIVPALEAVRNELLTVFLVIGSVVVGGYSLEDAAIAYGEAQVKSAVVQSALSTGVSSQTAQAAREAYQTINETSPKDDKWRG